MKKIKLLMGTVGKGKGGTPTYAVRLFSMLDKENFEVTFLSNTPHPYYEEEILAGGGRIAAIPSRSSHPLAHRRALRQALAEGFDICHIHLVSASNIDAVEEAVRAKVPFILAHSHCAACEGNTAAKLMHKYNLPRLRKLPIARLACSKSAGSYLFLDAPATVVPNAIDLARFAYREADRAAFRKKWGLEGCFVIGHVGRLVPIKNQVFLMETFVEVKKREPAARLVFAGDGPDEGMLRQRAAELGIENETLFLGNVPDPETVFNGIDCFVLCSLKEGFGMVVIEAAASGLPCFAADTAAPEVYALPSIQAFSLSDSKTKLAGRLLACRGLPRASQGDALRAAGFEAADQAKKMEERYLAGLKAAGYRFPAEEEEG